MVKRCHNYGLTLVTLVVCALFGPASPQAAGRSQMELNRREHMKLLKRANKLVGEKKQLGEVIHAIDDRQTKKEEEVRSVKKQLQQAEGKQADLQRQSEKCRKDLANYQRLLNQRARQIYMQGDLTYVDVLLQATNISDFVDRMFFVQAILEQDKNLLEGTQAARVELDESLLAIAQQIESVNQIKAKLDGELADLLETKKDKQRDFEAMDNSLELVLRQAKELEDENKRIAAALQSISRSGSGYSKVWSGMFTKPCPGPIMSPFGYRIHPIFHTKRKHTGVDIGAPEGTPVHPGGKGKVVMTGWMGGYGNAIVVDHGGGRSTLYGHLSKITCAVGDEVDTSDVIGKVGSTGFSTGNHLHFEVRISGVPVDPLGSLK